MQSRKPTIVAAGLGVALCLLQAPAAQQNSSKAPAPVTTQVGSGANQSATPSQTPTTNKAPGTSEGTVSVPPAAPAKEAAPDQGSIRVSVNEVIVPVTVTDDKGRFVSDLDKKDFEVFEDGKPQTIRYFTRERSQPVVIGFLVDLSNASKIHWKNYQDAIIELIQTLLPGDPKYSGYLIDYAQDAEVAVNTTTDPEPMVDKLRKLKPGGGAALYDAIYLACTSRKLVHGEPIEPRRVIVVIGDGHDNASKHSLDQVVELAQRNLVTVYCISTQAFGFTNESDANLVRLATETGGRVVYPLGDVYKDTDGYLSHPSDDGNYALTVGTGAYRSAVDGRMYHAVADIAGEVTMQYIIRYVSDNPSDKAYRNVKVVVDLGSVKVRARRGYYAGTATP
ncbi:MAG: VWA domain-containing protein [Acidobacteriaceae bacterium]|nr:VWA domain-containing protein [Acidobacteriaceae bacterium]